MAKRMRITKANEGRGISPLGDVVVVPRRKRVVYFTTAVRNGMLESFGDDGYPITHAQKKRKRATEKKAPDAKSFVSPIRFD